MVTAPRKRRQETMNTIKIPVNDRNDIEFAGREIAHVSTRTPDRPRWTELTLYARDEGGYVFHRIGRSNMYHSLRCRKVIGRIDMEPLPLTDVDVEDSPCPECNPNMTGNDTVVFERDKYSAVTVPDAAKLLVAIQDRDRVTHEVRISTLSQQLLVIASEKDEAILLATQSALLRGGDTV